MITPGEVDEFWRAMIDRQRIDVESFRGEVSLDLAMCLMASTKPDDPLMSPERMLLRLRQWHAPCVERTSVLAVMRHFKVGGSPEIRAIARAI